jgi:hypothetical protein
MKCNISEAVKRRNDAFKARKLKGVLKPLLNQFVRIPLKLETLRVGDELIVQQEEIRDKVKEFFTDWFAEPVKEVDRSCNLSADQWLNITWEEFKVKMAGACIPDSLLKLVYKAISKRVAVDDLLRKQEKLIATPSFDEFMTGVKEAKINCAAGVSGLTNAMMKLWSPELLRSVYDEIVKLWERKEVPEYWKWSWLAPIPKVQDPELKEAVMFC